MLTNNQAGAIINVSAEELQLYFNENFIPVRRDGKIMGLEVIGSPDDFAFNMAGLKFLNEADEYKFMIGDWAVKYAELHGREAYEKTAAYLGLAQPTIETWASVCRSIKVEARRPELSFTHHRLVAPLEPKLQKLWLQRAIEKGLGTRQLLQALTEKGLLESFSQDRLPGNRIQVLEDELGSLEVQYQEAIVALENAWVWFHRLRPFLAGLEVDEGQRKLINEFLAWSENQIGGERPKWLAAQNAEF